MSYQLISETTILRLKDEVYIPVDEANADYREYQKWLGVKRNKPLPPPQRPEAAPLTPEEKLRAAGLTIEDLRGLVAEMLSPAPLAPPAALNGVVPPPAESIGQAWTGPDGSLWVVVQARGAGGQFLADDPDTDARENLCWERLQVVPAETD